MPKKKTNFCLSRTKSLKNKGKGFTDALTYLVVGVILSVSGYLFYVLVVLTIGSNTHYSLIYIFCYLVMVVISYFSYSKVVFKSSPHIMGFLQYFLATQVNMWLSFALVLIGTELFHLDPLFSPLLPLMILTPLMFVVSKFYVFR